MPHGQEKELMVTYKPTPVIMFQTLFRFRLGIGQKFLLSLRTKTTFCAESSSIVSLNDRKDSILKFCPVERELDLFYR